MPQLGGELPGSSHVILRFPFCGVNAARLPQRGPRRRPPPRRPTAPPLTDDKSAQWQRSPAFQFSYRDFSRVRARALGLGSRSLRCGGTGRRLRSALPGLPFFSTQLFRL